MPMPFLDTNILLRHLLEDHPEHSPKATAFLSRIEHGQQQARTADTVIFETVFTLQRHYHIPKARIAQTVLPLIELPGIVLPGKRKYRKVFALYVEQNLPFADAYHAVLMESLKLTEIATFDEHFDHIAGIQRLEL
jgi:predicted nucleic acid-binding protein